MIARQTQRVTHGLWIMVAILLLAAAFRFLALDSAPPGWRDDELIEYNMDRRIADGWRPLFINEAEGHEPVYHYLHAGTIVLFGDNIIGYKWLPMACGLLTIALTYALARKMFVRPVPPVTSHQMASSHGEALRSHSELSVAESKNASRHDTGERVGLLAAALLAVSFWPIMYSRFGVRHIGVLPWMLGALYLLYPARIHSRVETTNTLKRVLTRLGYQSSSSLDGAWRAALASIFLAAALMTYFAGRAVPIILIGFLIYLLIFNRSILRQVWWRYLLAIGIAVLIALPMFVQIANTPGGEKRTEVVGGPLTELSKGNVRPAIDTTLGTLGMFTFAGDPEWLYNVEHRPVFDWITGLFFYLGVIICFIRLKRSESGFVLAWLVIGIAPAFVSIPAASFSHTIAALPAVYVLAAYGAITVISWLSDKMTRWQDNRMNSRRRIIWSALPLIILSMLVALGAWLTLRDYFGTWANEFIVRFQYHAPTREIAHWLDQQSEIKDVAIGTNPNELVLDPLALKLDMPHDIPASWFDAESVVVQPKSGPTIFTALQAPGAEVQRILSDTAHLQVKYPEFDVYAVKSLASDVSASAQDHLVLIDTLASGQTATPGQQIQWRTHWWIGSDLDQLRLKMFLHVLNGKGEVIVGDDREDLNFATLRTGDAFWQISRLTLPFDLLPGQYGVEIGWYDPVTGERLKRTDGSDRFLLTPLEVIAP